MADEPQVVRGIDWKSTFPFTQIFRSFRVAIHPSKLVLALVALLLIYFGGRILDEIWPANHSAVPEELPLYVTARTDPDVTQTFKQARDARRKDIVDRHKATLEMIGKPQGSLRDIKAWVLDERRKEIEAASQIQNERDRELGVRAAYESAATRWNLYKTYEGVGLFQTFHRNQLGQLHKVAREARNGRWISKDGVFDQIVNFFTVAPGWALRHHPVYFIIFFVYFLVIWAIFGGAIARIAAVQVARDEKISVRQALSFATAKFLSFVSAPIIPLLIVVVVGLVVAVGGFVTFNVPVLDIIGALLFFMALAAGFVMTLVILGLVGGFNLMYPTIAVEGSDSFDAISRSFSYLYARPWRLLLYTLVAAMYGALCYVFVRYFIKLMLSLTHYAAGALVFRDAPSTEPLWNVMWRPPLTATRLSYDIDFLTLSTSQDIAAFALSFWVYITIAMLGAFTISFYFSANTIIYILMRHEVDATELDDVYLEQTEEDFGETTTSAPAATAAAPAGTSGAAEASASAGSPAQDAPASSEPPPPSSAPPPPEGPSQA
jgi:hypothetical protein